MIHAYDQLYIEKARTSLGRMLDFAVYDLKYSIDAFFSLFIASGIADLFEAGDPGTVVGRSGVELAYEVLNKCGISYSYISPAYSIDRSEEYWVGWALAYYQWYTCFKFEYIVSCLSLRDIQALYDPYHEMDIRHFVSKMNELIHNSHPETNLQRLRLCAQYSQSQLAMASGIPLRTIQQYEQRIKNINTAHAESVFKLAIALNCEPAALLEKN